MGVAVKLVPVRMPPDWFLSILSIFETFSITYFVPKYRLRMRQFYARVSAAVVRV